VLTFSLLAITWTPGSWRCGLPRRRSPGPVRGDAQAETCRSSGSGTRLVRQRAALGTAPRRAVVQQGLIGVFETTCRDLLCASCSLGAAHGRAIGGSGGLVVEGGAEGGSGLPGEALEGL
jgi:hypothetical protein